MSHGAALVDRVIPAEASSVELVASRELATRTDTPELSSPQQFFSMTAAQATEAVAGPALLTAGRSCAGGTWVRLHAHRHNARATQGAAIHRRMPWVEQTRVTDAWSGAGALDGARLGSSMSSGQYGVNQLSGLSRSARTRCGGVTLLSVLPESEVRAANCAGG